jgi:hypothetical protein
MPEEAGKQVQLGALRVTPTHVEELDQSRVIVAVERQDVVRARVAWARRSERPLLLLLIAAACCIFGMLVILDTLHWLREGGTREAFAIMCALLLPLGGWIGYDALRRGPILLLETSRGRRRLAFGSRIEREPLLAFADAANRELSFYIEVDDSLRS